MHPNISFSTFQNIGLLISDVQCTFSKERQFTSGLECASAPTIFWHITYIRWSQYWNIYLTSRAVVLLLLLLFSKNPTRSSLDNWDIFNWHKNILDCCKRSYAYPPSLLFVSDSLYHSLHLCLTSLCLFLSLLCRYFLLWRLSLLSTVLDRASSNNVFSAYLSLLFLSISRFSSPI